MAICIPNPPPRASFAAPSYHFNGAAACFPRIPYRRPSLGIYCQLSDHQTAPQLAIPSSPIKVDRSLLSVSSTCSESELWAAACLRVRTFYDFKGQTFGIEDHKRHLAEREYEAVKERIAGKRKGFRKVSCINATLPMSWMLNVSADLCSSCKFSQNGGDRVVVGTLDINQCVSLPDEIVGMKPEGIGSDFARAYISNVCVAKELQRNGLGHELIAESKRVAEEWGISDLYVHVAVNNEAAKNLYLKSGFTLESDEPAWQARFLDRPRRLLLWMPLPITYQFFAPNNKEDLGNGFAKLYSKVVQCGSKQEFLLLFKEGRSSYSILQFHNFQANLNRIFAPPLPPYRRMG